ncbi:hypothetical protein [Longimicrobium terrae]|uniref:Uncharacterized protein n=1 Tax=Longimicrobium terrae TaxID=1639882 RepID=A0A841H543_9BACT|nr:hypothetical protein [Longimicrobium terrae]MBB4638767.1 hypothetical protein [Longimicrobium terrae]MBB6073006.1 hypothetical protein [Longimicrobium terrae]NNC33130.1 hypothetical protein [Longimicrobium terrae]
MRLSAKLTSVMRVLVPLLALLTVLPLFAGREAGREMDRLEAGLMQRFPGGEAHAELNGYELKITFLNHPLARTKAQQADIANRVSSYLAREHARIEWLRSITVRFGTEARPAALNFVRFGPTYTLDPHMIWPRRFDPGESDSVGGPA